MQLFRPHKLMAILAVFGCTLAAPAKSYAIFSWLFGNGCCGTSAQTTYTPISPPCPTQSCNYMPVTAFRTTAVNVPVTAFRPVVANNPCTGCATTSFRPVTTWVTQYQSVPYQTFRPVCNVAAPVTTQTSTYFAPTAFQTPGASAAPMLPAAPAFQSAPVVQSAPAGSCCNGGASMAPALTSPPALSTTPSTSTFSTPATSAYPPTSSYSAPTSSYTTPSSSYTTPSSGYVAPSTPAPASTPAPSTYSNGTTNGSSTPAPSLYTPNGNQHQQQPAPQSTPQAEPPKTFEPNTNSSSSSQTSEPRYTPVPDYNTSVTPLRPAPQPNLIDPQSNTAQMPVTQASYTPIAWESRGTQAVPQPAAAAPVRHSTGAGLWRASQR